MATVLKAIYKDSKVSRPISKIQQEVEVIMTKYDKDGSKALTIGELVVMCAEAQELMLYDKMPNADSVRELLSRAGRLMCKEKSEELSVGFDILGRTAAEERWNRYVGSLWEACANFTQAGGQDVHCIRLPDPNTSTDLLQHYEELELEAFGGVSPRSRKSITYGKRWVKAAKKEKKKMQIASEERQQTLLSPVKLDLGSDSPERPEAAQEADQAPAAEAENVEALDDKEKAIVDTLDADPSETAVGGSALDQQREALKAKRKEDSIESASGGRQWDIPETG